MKVKCIDTNGAKGITIGKIYTAKVATHSNYLKIINDNGDVKNYIKHRFETVVTGKESR